MFNETEYKAKMYDKVCNLLNNSLAAERARAINGQEFYDSIKDMPEAANKDILLKNIEDAKSAARAYERVLSELGYAV